MLNISTHKNTLNLILLFILFCYFLVNVSFVLNRDIWSPIDEIAHYDYIDKLSDGHIPHSQEQISDYTLDLVKKYKSTKPDSFDGTKASLSTIGISYEVQQPPVYYLLLAIPNNLIKNNIANSQTQIEILRIINALFFFLAALVTILIFKQLEIIYPGKINVGYGYFYAFVILIADLPMHYHISNDQLSLLTATITIFFMLKFYNHRLFFYWFLALCSAILCFLTKYSSGYIGVAVLVASVPLIATESNRFKQLVYYFTIVCLGLLLLLFLYTFSFKEKIDFVKQFFLWIEPRDLFGVLEPLLRFSISIEYIYNNLIINYKALIVLMFINLAIAYYQYCYKHNHYSIALVGSLFAVLVIISALLLNAYQLGVSWHEFRHYNAYALFWFISVFQVPLFIFSKIIDIKKLTLVIFLSFLPFYWLRLS